MIQEAEIGDWLRRQPFYRGDRKDDPQVRIIKKFPFLTGHQYFVDTSHAGAYQISLNQDGTDMSDNLSTALERNTVKKIPFTEGAELHGFLPDRYTLERVDYPDSPNLNFRLTDTGTGEHCLFRVFHYLPEGINDEVEMLSQLSGPHFPSLLGHVTLDLDEKTYTLSAVESFNAGEKGSEIAKQNSSAGFYEHNDLMKLGQTVRYMHDALAMAFPTDSLPRHYMGDHLWELFDILLADHPHLEEYRSHIAALIDGMPEEFPVQRIHGNLRLEVTLYDEGQWTIIDFEESVPYPGAAELRSPTDDIAGIVGSLRSHGANNPMWCENVVRSFLEGYGQDKITPTFKACMAHRGLVMLAEATTDAGRFQGRRMLSLGA